MIQIFKSVLLLALIAGFLGFGMGQAFAMKTAIRCNGALINVGDSVFKVLSKCGKPKMELSYKGNPITYYYKQYGMEYKLSFKDGTVSRITRGRQR